MNVVRYCRGPMRTAASNPRVPFPHAGVNAGVGSSGDGMGPGPGATSNPGGAGRFLFASGLLVLEGEGKRRQLRVFVERPWPPVFVQGRSPWNEVSHWLILRYIY